MVWVFDIKSAYSSKRKGMVYCILDCCVFSSGNLWLLIFAKWDNVVERISFTSFFSIYHKNKEE